jgi:hypothetical protein
MDMTNLTHLWFEVSYYPRCLILLAKYRSLPSNMTLKATLAGIAQRQIRPHWLRG